MPQRESSARADIDGKLRAVLSGHPDIALAIVFGSLARDSANRDSDLDLAVAGQARLGPDARVRLIEDLAYAFGRPVDLVDLQEAHGPILHQAVTRGRLLLCKDRTLYAEIIRRMLYEEADVMPYYRRILAERRRAWIGK